MRRAKVRVREAARRDEINTRERAKYARNRDQRREYWSDWIKRNPGRAEAYRRAADHKRRSALGSFTGAEWREVLHRHGYRCYYCGSWGIDLWVDHRLPLSRGGWNVAANVVPACPPCNMSKGRLTDEEFLARLNRERRAFDPKMQVVSWIAGFGAVPLM